jgi:hypothetical protein
VGNTGYSTGPHIELQYIKNGSPIDPTQFVQQTGQGTGGGPLDIAGGIQAIANNIAAFPGELANNVAKSAANIGIYVGIVLVAIILLIIAGLAVIKGRNTDE